MAYFFLAAVLPISLEIVSMAGNQLVHCMHETTIEVGIEDTGFPMKATGQSRIHFNITVSLAYSST